MSEFDTSVNMASITDHETGKKVKSIIEKYLDHEITQALCDEITQDVTQTFGTNHPAQVLLDDETHEIQIIVRDINGRYVKCSSLTLFPEAYL